MDAEALVYVELGGEAVPVGRLWARTRKGRDSASFEYDEAWLKHPERFALQPALRRAERQDSRPGQARPTMALCS